MLSKLNFKYGKVSKLYENQAEVNSCKNNGMPLDFTNNATLWTFQRFLGLYKQA